jgi:hypothetical protein
VLCWMLAEIWRAQGLCGGPSCSSATVCRRFDGLTPGAGRTTRYVDIACRPPCGEMLHAEYDTHGRALPRTSPLRVDAGTHSASGWLRWSGLRSPPLDCIHPSTSRALAHFSVTLLARSYLSTSIILVSSRFRPGQAAVPSPAEDFRLFVAATDAHADSIPTNGLLLWTHAPRIPAYVWRRLG